MDSRSRIHCTSGFGRIGGGGSIAGFNGERGAGLETGGFMPPPFNSGRITALITVKAGWPASGAP